MRHHFEPVCFLFGPFFTETDTNNGNSGFAGKDGRG